MTVKCICPGHLLRVLVVHILPCCSNDALLVSKSPHVLLNSTVLDMVPVRMHARMQRITCGQTHADRCECAWHTGNDFAQPHASCNCAWMNITGILWTCCMLTTVLTCIAAEYPWLCSFRGTANKQQTFEQACAHIKQAAGMHNHDVCFCACNANFVYETMPVELGTGIERRFV